MMNAWRIVNLPNWTLEKRGTRKGDVVESTKTEQFGKVYRFTVSIVLTEAFNA